MSDKRLSREQQIAALEKDWAENPRWKLVKRGYNENLAIGSLATAGTLGILIPPSITMVVYAVAADASIIRIFLAGFLPGLLLMLLFSGYIGWWSLRNVLRQPVSQTLRAAT